MVLSLTAPISMNAPNDAPESGGLLRYNGDHPVTYWVDKVADFSHSIDTYTNVQNRSNGAQKRTRTSTPLQAPAPEAGASTNSAIWARVASRYVAWRRVGAGRYRGAREVSTPRFKWWGTARTRLASRALLDCLALDIATAIVQGRQPASLTSRAKLEAALPLGWAGQRLLPGFA